MGAKASAMQAGNSITRGQPQTGASFGAAMMQSITGTMASDLILKTLPSCSRDWRNTSSKPFLSLKGFASRTPGAERLIPVRASVHFGELLIAAKPPMLWVIQEWVLERRGWARALCLIFSIRRKLSVQNSNSFEANRFHFLQNLYGH